MRRRDFLLTSGLTGSLAGCLRLEEGEAELDSTDSESGSPDESDDQSQNTGEETTETDVDHDPNDGAEADGGEQNDTDTGDAGDDEADQTEGDTDEGGDGDDGGTDEGENGDEDGTDDGGEDDDGTTTVSGSWTAFGNGPSNAGLAESAAGVGEYEVLWTRELPMDRVPGPVVADGTLYTYGNGLTAIDAATGDVRWSVPIRGGRSTPTYVGDGLVAGNSDRTAFVSLDGNVQWERTSGGDGHAVTDEAIYTAGQGNVWAFDLSGELVWDERIDVRTTAVPAVANGTVCVGTREGSVFGFDADSGSREWTFDVAAHSDRDDPAGYDVQGGVTIYGGTAYFGTWDRTVYAVDVGTGDLEWKRETNGGIDPCPAAADGTIYVGNDGGKILALDAATGDREWVSDRLGSPLSRGIALSDDTAYAVGGEGLLAAVDRTDGTMRWRHLLSNERMRGSPAVADGYVFITDGAGVVYAFVEQ